MAIRNWVARNIFINKSGLYTVQVFRGGKHYNLNSVAYDKAVKFRDEIDEKFPSKTRRNAHVSEPYENRMLCQKLISHLYVICEKCERLTNNGEVYSKDESDAPEAFGVLCPKCAGDKNDK